MSKNAKERKGPMLLHVITKKGKGYRYAEEHPDKYHGVSKFDIREGVQPSGKKSISAAVGEKLSQMACVDDRIVAITAAMPSGTGLNIFEKIIQIDITMLVLLNSMQLHFRQVLRKME